MKKIFFICLIPSFLQSQELVTTYDVNAILTDIKKRKHEQKVAYIASILNIAQRTHDNIHLDLGSPTTYYIPSEAEKIITTCFENSIYALLQQEFIKHLAPNESGNAVKEFLLQKALKYQNHDLLKILFSANAPTKRIFHSMLENQHYLPYVSYFLRNSPEKSILYQRAQEWLNKKEWMKRTYSGGIGNQRYYGREELSLANILFYYGIKIPNPECNYPNNVANDLLYYGHSRRVYRLAYYLKRLMNGKEYSLPQPPLAGSGKNPLYLPTEIFLKIAEFVYGPLNNFDLQQIRNYKPDEYTIIRNKR